MEAALFKRQPRAALIALLVMVAGAVLAFAYLSIGAGPAQAKVHHAKHRVHHARHQSTTSDQPGSTDPGNVQSGDQTTPDTTGAAPGESTGSGESSVESEAGQPGEPANGHQDTGSNVSNECADTCVQ